MAKKDRPDLKALCAELPKGKVLWFQIHAPWSQESQKWREGLLQSAAFQTLKKECHFVDSPVEDWTDEAQGFQAFAQFHTGHSGWPLNLFLNRNGHAIFCCGSVESSALIQLVASLIQAYSLESAALDLQAEEKRKQFIESDPCALRSEDAQTDGHDLSILSAKTLQRLLAPLEQNLDMNSGLIGGKTVFHYPSVLRALLLSGEQRKWAEKFLVKICRSPLYDVVGGGFFRSMDREASKTATEKLLVENAELLDLILEFLATEKHPFLEEIAANTLDLIRKEFRASDGSLYAALSASPEFYEWESRDLFAALGSEDRGIAQKFFGLVGTQKTVPFIATEITALSKEWELEPLDLRLRLLDVRRKLLAYAQKHRLLNHPAAFPAQTYASAIAIASLSRAAFQWDIPELLDDCINQIEKTRLDEDLGPRERWAQVRALLAVGRTLAASGRVQEASSLVTRVEDELLLESDFSKVTFVSSTVFGDRMDIADHLGMSAGALFIHALLDLKALRKHKIFGARNLPFSEHEALALALQKSRTLGLNAGGVYSALARHLIMQ